MINTFVSADHHFGHANVLRLCNRPFDTVEQMDLVFIELWNSVIGQNDLVYYLGDFTLNNEAFARSIFRQLNGMIHILANPWHHDKRWLKKGLYYTASQEIVVYAPPIQVVTVEKVKVTFCHYPLAEWEASYHMGVHLHAHCHGNLPRIANRLDVGVDVHNYYPILFEDAVKLAQEEIVK